MAYHYLGRHYRPLTDDDEETIMSGGPPNLGSALYNSMGGLNSYGSNQLMGAQQNGLGQTYQAFPGYSNQGTYFTFTAGGTFDVAAFKAGNKAKHRAIPQEGIRAGEILAYRFWNVSQGYKEALKLRSVSAQHTWEPGATMTAADDDVEGGLGVHCFRELHQAVACSYEYRGGSPMAIGSIEIWGEIVELENGYRAQFAKVKEILFCRDFPSQKTNVYVLEALRKAYFPPAPGPAKVIDSSGWTGIDYPGS